MPLSNIEPSRLYRRIALQLRGLIVAGEYAPGTRLPPERDLAVQLGVSRPSVREALIALEVEGYVEIRIGSGIYARKPDAKVDNSADNGNVTDNIAINVNPGVAHEDGPLELIRARAVLEPEIAALAARNIKRAQLDLLAKTIDLMEADAAAGRIPTAGDRQFHVRIAEVAGNGVLVSMTGQLFDGRANPLFTKLALYFENPKSWAAAIGEHRQVLEALASRDADAARDAMRHHMRMSHKRFNAGWPKTQRKNGDGR